MTTSITSNESASQNTPASVLVDRDEEHLRLLSLYHFVMAGFNGAVLLIFVMLPLVLGPSFYEMLGIPVNPNDPHLQARLLTGLLLGGLSTLIFALNGWFLKKHQYRICCLILSVFECLASMPMGIILGISAIRVLQREGVKARFRSVSVQ